MKIWIYPKDGSSPSNYYEITPYITNEVDEQKRSDDAFAITTFKAFIPEDAFSLAKYNIAPFTIFEIATVPNHESITSAYNKRYFGYSKCTKYLRKQTDNKTYYVHDITLLEPTAILEAIQIGTKTFTNRGDLVYIPQLLQIIKNTTGIEITKLGNWSISEIHSYSFDKGTTAFEILNEIMKMNNWKMLLSFAQPYDLYPYWIRLTLEHTLLSNIPTIEINENELTLVEYNQNQDDYCNYLESEVDNVVDRNTETIYNNLTVRSDDNNCKADNCFIELPAKIESASKLFVYFKVNENFNIYVVQDMYDAVNAAYGLRDLTYTEIKTAINSIKDENDQPKYNSTFLDALMEVVKQNNPEFDLDNYVFSGSIVGYNYVFTGLRHIDETYTSTSFGWYDISNKMKSEAIYMGLTPQQQTKFCYFSSGSNKIEGIYKYYKDGWVNQLLQITGYPMLHNCIDRETTAYSNILIDNNEYVRVYYKVENQQDNPMEVLFRVIAKPITNQYVKNKKELQLNEGRILPISRSYGKNANYIDYDVMRKNISISNSFLGTPELTLQFFDSCSLTENSKFVYDDNTWYVMSVITNITRNHIIYTVNASTNYNKQADCIGVRTQYQATKIALDNIKERHIYYELNSALELYNGSSYYFNILFEHNDDTVVGFYIPVNVYASENGVTLVASTIDNYSIGKYLKIGDSSNQFIQQDAKYCDDRGEVKSIYLLELGRFDDPGGIALTLDASRKLPVPSADLPNFSVDATIISEAAEIGIIYKDEHESLVFTVYLPNATYED